MKYLIPNSLMIAAGLCLLSAGCCTTHCKVTKSDGTALEVDNSRFLWQTESYTCTFNTNSATLTANGSNPDKEAMSIVTQAAVQAAVGAATKTVAP